MNFVYKYLGMILLLVGVLILAVPHFTGGITNSVLLIGMGTILLGYLAHIFLNKKVE
jgi:uncharacterized membrane protein HdeD (DUF308 family)